MNTKVEAEVETPKECYMVQSIPTFFFLILTVHLSFLQIDKIPHE